MSRPIIVVGGGGHARVVIDALRMLGREIVGISDPALQVGAGGPFGIEILGGDEAVEAYAADRVDLVNGVGSTNDTTQRRAVFERFSALGYRFAAVIHPSAIVARDVEFGDGAQLMAGSVVQTGSTIGRNAIVNTRASIDHDCRIHDHVHVAPGAVLSGGVTVGESSHVGIGAAVIQGVTIGQRCLIGAGAVALKNLPDDAVLITPSNRTTMREKP